MHFASFSQVGESVQQPAKYYANNVTNTLHLLAGYPVVKDPNPELSLDGQHWVLAPA
jgi:dTDP-D-glucose 4,6-dehydratase